MNKNEIKKAIERLQLKNVSVDTLEELSYGDLCKVIITGGHNHDILKNQIEYLDQIKAILNAIPNSSILKLKVDNADDIYYLEILVGKNR